MALDLTFLRRTRGNAGRNVKSATLVFLGRWRAIRCRNEVASAQPAREVVPCGRSKDMGTVVVKRLHRVEQHRSGIPGIEAMTLFSNHAFPRHSHDQLGIGIMTSGAQRSWSVIGQVESEAGDVIMVNPGEMHDGMPVDGCARGWRILYLDPTLVAREIADEPTDGDLIVRPVARDPQLARHVVRLFAQVENPSPDSLAAEESLLRCLMRVLRRHGVRGPSHGLRVALGVEGHSAPGGRAGSLDIAR